jgi:hypothetical protein
VRSRVCFLREERASTHVADQMTSGLLPPTNEASHHYTNTQRALTKSQLTGWAPRIIIAPAAHTIAQKVFKGRGGSAPKLILGMNSNGNLIVMQPAAQSGVCVYCARSLFQISCTPGFKIQARRQSRFWDIEHLCVVCVLQLISLIYVRPMQMTQIYPSAALSIITYYIYYVYIRPE